MRQWGRRVIWRDVICHGAGADVLLCPWRSFSTFAILGLLLYCSPSLVRISTTDTFRKCLTPFWPQARVVI